LNGVLMNVFLNAVCAPLGFRAAGVACGLKAKDQPDLAVIISDRPASASGLFTTNLICGAPVIVTRRHLRTSSSHMRAVVVNAGNSNACTGARGEADAKEMCRLVTDGLGCGPSEGRS